ncbi:hypothetical protein SteCoe_35761 [Stentor coeruleus]|uniref:PPM-type phosphatase domain-containing protein n=1 Tax=Stentor coeruleus TaxID=5963 RepID=A0A1R2ARM8_9CILI|nr:hypothetical protein SteCoe_35761 [Stentor coeruleus]
MGCFTSAKSKPLSINSDALCQYPRTGKIPVKLRNIAGVVIDRQTVSFNVTEPILITSNELQFADEKILISSCVLPGIDPRGEYKKKCQDNCFYLTDSDGILCCLFDGHGAEGEKVAEFCEGIIEGLFNQKKQLLKEHPFNFIKHATERCDSELQKKSSGIDSDFSGCTGVMIYITSTDIFCGSVGDSRGMLGTTIVPEILPAPPANLGAEREILAAVKQKRKSVIETQINSIQLTRDQKPEDPEELQRIVKAGGRVQRLTDNAGNKIGPYRVWKQHANTPGLAMSRSIGDMIAKNIGVISEPVCTSYKRTSGDLFIVIASDGVWDAMDNEDVGTFIECYRRKCRTGINSCPLGTEVNFSNTCIAQILCEEARMRWYTIVEEEDVMIDDISCIVLEIKRTDEILAKHSKRPVPMDDVGEKVPDDGAGEGLRRAPTLKEIAVRDPRRGSIVSDKIPGFEG